MIYLLVLLAVIGCMALLDWRHRLFLWARPGAALVVLMLRLLLAQAVARDAEATELQAELSEVI